MSQDRAGALALIVGTVMLVLVAAAHPTGRDVIGHGHLPIAHAAALGRGVHALALVGLLVLTFGHWRLSERLGLVRSFVALALGAHAFGAIAMLVAATLSGFVTTPILETAAGLPHTEQRAPLEAAALAYRLNQGFAIVAASFQAAALVLWGLGWTGRGAGDWAMRALGLVVGGAVLAVNAAGVPIDVHGFAARTAAMSLFQVAAAIWLWRRNPA